MTANAWRAAIAAFGLPLTERGGSFRGPCPFHRGRNRTAFGITPGKGFHCFACGESGGLTRFLRLMEAETGIRAPHLAEDIVVPPAAASPSRVARLGPLDPAHSFLAGRGIHAATARFFEAGHYAGPGAFADHIVFPLHDGAGLLLGHLGRRTGSGAPRYRVQKGIVRSSTLFNLHRVLRLGSRDVIVVEGPFDALAVHQAGFPDVVALLSCHASAAQLVLLRGFRSVRVFLDDDPPGRDGTAALLDALPGAVRVPVPAADPCVLKGSVVASALRAVPSPPASGRKSLLVPSSAVRR